VFVGLLLHCSYSMYCVLFVAVWWVQFSYRGWEEKATACSVHAKGGCTASYFDLHGLLWLASLQLRFWPGPKWRTYGLVPIYRCLRARLVDSGWV
jgi:hypothetical protein